ncbi:MAG TPA: hypothetical protein VJ827_12075, partial [Rubrobacter sp.]|nr:hypothetical protein [Rubrobacter sp.]
SPEVLASSLRRAASFLCPVDPGQLVHSLAAALAGIAGDDDELTNELEELVEAIIGYGDLLELAVVDEASLRARRRLFLAQPSYIERKSGACLLLGIRAEGVPLVDGDLAAAVEHEGHVRWIAASEDLPELLQAQGLREIQQGQWLDMPRLRPAEDVVDEYVGRLSAAGPAGDITGLRLLDPAAPVRYYRGRWRPATKRDTGTFVARRPQAFGAELWCFAHLKEGSVERLIDLPVGVQPAPARDEAWWLQAALDAVRGVPQQLGIREAHGSGRLVLDLFSPVPSWAQRRLDAVGTPLLRGRGALMSYSFEPAEVEEEVAFLSESLWMSPEWR